MPMILTIKKEIGDIDLEIGQIVSYKKELWIINRIGTLAIEKDNQDNRMLKAQIAVQNVDGPYRKENDCSYVECRQRGFFPIGSWIMDDDKTQVIVITGIKSVKYKDGKSMFDYTAVQIELFDKSRVRRALVEQRTKKLGLKVI